jgi:hypothetical protein
LRTISVDLGNNKNQILAIITIINNNITTAIYTSDADIALKNRIYHIFAKQEANVNSHL